jgi:hypothetical protein
MAEISDRTANRRRRGPGQPFPRGVSGNPGGRPKALADVQELARTYTPAAIKALGDALSSPRERVAAATALLDRAWGKPTAHIAGDDSAGPLRYEFVWADAVTTEPTHAAIDGAEAAADFIVASDGESTH